jgi:2-polyprenyl-6-methoxyphenol hydroxylase-like FAD-dependent oxidoreductase
VLLGDAGHFKDPTPGQGIGDAFRQAARLAPSIEDGMGTAALDAAMRRWWQWRDDDAYEMYWFASDMGAAGAASPLTTRLMRDVADDPIATQMFFGVLNHVIRPSQLFTSPRAARAAARALLDRPDRLLPTLKEILRVGRQNVLRARQRMFAQS